MGKDVVTRDINRRELFEMILEIYGKDTKRYE